MESPAVEQPRISQRRNNPLSGGRHTSILQGQGPKPSVRVRSVSYDNTGCYNRHACTFGSAARWPRPGTIRENQRPGNRSAADEMTNTYCPNCGTPIPEGAAFCPGCGRLAPVEGSTQGFAQRAASVPPSDDLTRPVVPAVTHVERTVSTEPGTTEYVEEVVTVRPEEPLPPRAVPGARRLLATILGVLLLAALGAAVFALNDHPSPPRRPQAAVIPTATAWRPHSAPLCGQIVDFLVGLTE